jgi:hypothetical protein
MLFLQICQVTGGDLEAVGNLGAGQKAVGHGFTFHRKNSEYAKSAASRAVMDAMTLLSAIRITFIRRINKSTGYQECSRRYPRNAKAAAADSFEKSLSVTASPSRLAFA